MPLSFARYRAGRAMARRRPFYAAYTRRYGNTPMRHRMGQAYRVYSRSRVPLTYRRRVVRR